MGRKFPFKHPSNCVRRKKDRAILGGRIDMAINFTRDSPPKWLVDMDPHLNGVHQRVPI